jgi:hypothetical protein
VENLHDIVRIYELNTPDYTSYLLTLHF